MVWKKKKKKKVYFGDEKDKISEVEVDEDLYEDFKEYTDQLRAEASIRDLLGPKEEKRKEREIKSYKERVGKGRESKLMKEIKKALFNATRRDRSMNVQEITEEIFKEKLEEKQEEIGKPKREWKEEKQDYRSLLRDWIEQREFSVGRALRTLEKKGETQRKEIRKKKIHFFPKQKETRWKLA